jgi:hypothetical protein
MFPDVPAMNFGAITLAVSSTVSISAQLTPFTLRMDDVYCSRCVSVFGRGVNFVAAR